MALRLVPPLVCSAIAGTSLSVPWSRLRTKQIGPGSAPTLLLRGLTALGAAMDQPKACGHCNEHLPPSEFSPDKRTSTGLKSWCKPCSRAANRTHYELNRDKKAAYTAANKDRKREYDRAYFELHREKRTVQLRAAGAAYYQRLRDGGHTATPRPLLERVGYKGAHSRLFRQLGLASTRECVDCTQPATDWSYNYTDPEAFVEPSGRHKGCFYSADVAHYSPRCRPCHMNFDAAHRLG